MIFNLIWNLLNVLFFLNGFCPLLYNNQSDKIQHIGMSSNLNISEFDRTILMIVDALRLDFIRKDYMPHTTSLIEKHGCFMDVKVSSPTVTLPRIKALTTGSIPQFVDIFYNIGNPQCVSESLLHSVQQKKKNIIFFGDDTWLKVFPHMFHRQEGTTSFLVTDFHEVDDNVTRNINSELEREDWNLMILHYLGLDHIGHVHGPFSPLVPSKLKEMDDIFSGLFQKTFKKKGSSLILLTGDHGMKDTGGHGGSSYAEVHVPLVILGISCRNDSIEQVDVAANLAILLNLDIPSSSIGKLNRNFLNDLTLQQYLSALSYNSKVLGAKNTLCHDEFLLASNFHKTYLHTGDITMASKAIKLFEKCSAELNDVLIKSSVKQNFLSMIVSVIFVVYAFIISLTNFEILGKHIYPYFIYIILLLIRCFFDEYYVLFFGISVIFIQLIGTLKTLNISEYCNSDNTINTILFFQPFTWLSSSFIEEEQEYWYFSLNSFLVFQLIKSVKLQKPEFIKHWLLIAAFFRFSQTLNQTGDKWSAVPDSSDFLMKSENYFIYVVFVAISVISIYLTCFYDYHSYFTFFDILILIVIYAFKINMFNPIFLARTVYLLIATSLIINKHFINFWILLVCLVSKSHNLCLISMAIYTSRRIIEEYDTSTVTIVAHLILGKSLFFMQGNGNSLSNVDVSVGYIGLNSFQPILVGIQLLVNIYSLTILMHLLLINAYYFEKRRNILKVLYVDRLYSMLVCCLVSFIFRSHISVWTIYAPKLFIEFFHTVILFLEVVVYYLVLFLRGSRKSNLKSSEL